MQYPAWLLAALSLTLAACAVNAVEKAETRPGACGAVALEGLIGRDASALDRLSPRPKMLRVLRPGTPMTMDFSAERLNVELDGNDTIVRVFCG